MKNKWACWQEWSGVAISRCLICPPFYIRGCGIRKARSENDVFCSFLPKRYSVRKASDWFFFPLLSNAEHWPSTDFHLPNLTFKINHLLKGDRYQIEDISRKCASSAPPTLAPRGTVSPKGWNEVTIKSQRADNFPHICEKCNLSVTLMMSADCCVQRGIGLKRLWRGQGKPFQMERRRGKRDTIATKGVRYGSLGLRTGSSLSQLLVSSWSNWINRRGDSGRPGGCAVGANVGQISPTEEELSTPPAMPSNHPLTLKTFSNLLWLWNRHAALTSSITNSWLVPVHRRERFYWRGNEKDEIDLTSWDANKVSLAESVTGDMSKRSEPRGVPSLRAGFLLGCRNKMLSLLERSIFPFLHIHTSDEVDVGAEFGRWCRNMAE